MAYCHLLLPFCLISLCKFICGTTSSFLYSLPPSRKPVSLRSMIVITHLLSYLQSISHFTGRIIYSESVDLVILLVFNFRAFKLILMLVTNKHKSNYLMLKKSASSTLAPVYYQQLTMPQSFYIAFMYNATQFQMFFDYILFILAELI